MWVRVGVREEVSREARHEYRAWGGWRVEVEDTGKYAGAGGVSWDGIVEAIGGIERLKGNMFRFVCILILYVRGFVGKIICLGSDAKAYRYEGAADKRADADVGSADAINRDAVFE